MSTALSGPAADLGQNMRAGVLACFERANQNGGIKGRPMALTAVDDGYEPVRTGPQMRQLIERDHVLAVIGNVGTPTAIAAIPIANEQRTLFYAAFTGAGVLRRTPPDRYVINYRASYAEETAAMIDALITGAGLRPEEIAFFTQRDGYGDAGFAGGIAALKRHELANDHDVLHVRYERNTVAVENALADVLMHDPAPRAIIMVGAYAPCAKFIGLAEQAGLESLFLNVSFVGSAPLARELVDSSARVIVTQVVPHPAESELPIVTDYREDLRAQNPDATPTFGGLEGYLACRILVTALESIEGTPDRESIVDALEGLGSFDPGIGEQLRLSASQHQASHRVWPTVMRDGKFLPFDWAKISDVVEAQ